ncbi:carboxypeptidase M32 [Francisella frigiditurris]|nr:carboxypeptidase M32 [Francisella frigiditurris]
MNIKQALESLNNILSEKKKYNHAISLMHWDLETEAPKNSVNTTSEVIGFFSQKNYEIMNSEELDKSLQILNKDINDLDEISRRIVYLTTKDKVKLSKIPKEEYVEYTKLISQAQNIWAEARRNNDFVIFAPYLEKIIKYQKKYVNYIGYVNHPYDVLLDDYEEGMTVAKLDPFFNGLREKIVPLLDKIKKQPQVRVDFLKQSYSVEKQKQFSRDVAKYLGFNFDSGLLKESAHPFTLNFNKYDVRMTTRYMEKLFASSIFSTIHETGHAMYEQNIGDDIYNTTLGTGVTLGIHESQSRFYENLVGKNKSFWVNQYSNLQNLFSDNLSEVSLEEFYKGINSVEPGFIRVEADELTYPLHILIRYEIEKEIFEKDISVNDLPKLWNRKYEEYLGISPKNFKEGILQDVHWSAGLFGYFPTYALGTVYASQIFSAMNEKIDINQCLEKGDLSSILKYLNQNIHQYGSFKTADEIIYNLSGEYLNPNHYIDYLEKKFNSIYTDN